MMYGTGLEAAFSETSGTPRNWLVGRALACQYGLANTWL